MREPPFGFQPPQGSKEQGSDCNSGTSRSQGEIARISRLFGIDKRLAGGRIRGDGTRLSTISSLCRGAALAPNGGFVGDCVQCRFVEPQEVSDGQSWNQSHDQEGHAKSEGENRAQGESAAESE